jgi:hypothetical protein
VRIQPLLLVCSVMTLLHGAAGAQHEGGGRALEPAVDHEGAASAWNTAALEGMKPSQLPFSVSEYIARCGASLPTVKGVPQATARCAPTYFPYVASRRSRGTISKLVGAHAYQKGGARNDSEDYNNPVANNLHPVFLVFPPLGDVVLVRVDDVERAEDRDVIKGAYLSIKDGKVVDQLNSNCNFDAEYVCATADKQRKVRLTQTGKFVRLE